MRRGLDVDGARLRRTRQLHERYHSPDLLAVATGLNPSYLCQIERGIRRPSGPTLRKVCQALDIEPESVIVENSDVGAGAGRRVAAPAPIQSSGRVGRGDDAPPGRTSEEGVT